MTFDIPFDGFVTVTGSGNIYNSIPNSQAWAEVFLVVDNSNPYAIDYSTIRSVDLHGCYPTGCVGGVVPGEGVETTGTYYLTKGTHTVYMNGGGNVSNCENCLIYLRFVSLTAIASNKGNQTVI